jgi:hypothetical protein
MGIGLSIFLLAVGAILAFAVNTTTFQGVDVHVVGWILMAAGVIGLIWSLIITWSRRQVVLEPRQGAVTRVVERDQPVVQRDLPVEDVVRREAP